MEIQWFFHCNLTKSEGPAHLGQICFYQTQHSTSQREQNSVVLACSINKCLNGSQNKSMHFNPEYKNTCKLQMLATQATYKLIWKSLGSQISTNGLRHKIVWNGEICLPKVKADLIDQKSYKHWLAGLGIVPF